MGWLFSRLLAFFACTTVTFAAIFYTAKQNDPWPGQSAGLSGLCYLFDTSAVLPRWPFFDAPGGRQGHSFFAYEWLDPWFAFYADHEQSSSCLSNSYMRGIIFNARGSHPSLATQRPSRILSSVACVMHLHTFLRALVEFSSPNG